MNRKTPLALAGATLIAATLPGGSSAAGGTAVTVRVEGLKKTLLAPTVVHVHGGWITRYRAPKGACSDRSAQGALDAASSHRWRGTWSTQFGPEYEITSILGEAHSFSSRYFWEIFVDNVAASTGACELKLHRGEQLLFAAVPQSQTEYPIALEAPRKVMRGRVFTVKVVWWGPTGKPSPLAGAKVSAGAISAEPIPHGQISATTNSKGLATLTESRLGLIELVAGKRGYIRAAPVAREVTP